MVTKVLTDREHLVTDVKRTTGCLGTRPMWHPNSLYSALLLTRVLCKLWSEVVHYKRNRVKFHILGQPYIRMKPVGI